MRKVLLWVQKWHEFRKSLQTNYYQFQMVFVCAIFFNFIIIVIILNQHFYYSCKGDYFRVFFFYFFSFFLCTSDKCKMKYMSFYLEIKWNRWLFRLFSINNHTHTHTTFQDIIINERGIFLDLGVFAWF